MPAHGTATFDGQTAWMNRSPGESQFGQMVTAVDEEDAGNLDSKAMLLFSSSFIQSDWMGLTPEAVAVFGGPARRRVTHAFYFPCWCGCGSERAVHLHADNAGVIECIATRSFKMYDAAEFRRRNPEIAVCKPPRP